MRVRWMLAMVVAAALAGQLSGCGKKPDKLDPPPGTESGYPRTYPTSR